MMALDPRIPLMAEGIPLEPRMNSLMRAGQMQGMQQQAAMREMQMQQLRQAMAAEAEQRKRQEAQQQEMQGYLASLSGNAGPPQQFNVSEALRRVGPEAAKTLQEMLTPKPAESYTLTPGAMRYGPDGKLIASAPVAPKEQKLPPVGELQSFRDTLPQGDPRRREVQAVIDNMTRAPKYASAPIGGGGAGGAAATAPPKPLPPGALKMQQDALDKIGIASSINADLGAIEQQITGGKLKFGPVSNLANAGLNMAGISTEESRNFASFKSTLERLRNESLRLNTGVQTDGDAQRAWAELFQNINDTGLVKQRLKEIKGINERGAELQKLRADSVRANYGLEPIDATEYANQKPALQAPGGFDADKERRYQEWKRKQGGGK